MNFSLKSQEAPFDHGTFIHVDDIPVLLKRNHLSKNMSLRIDPIEKIPVVVAPPKLSRKRIENFLHKSKEWLQEKMAPLKTVTDSPKNILFHGNSHKIIIHPPLSKRSKVDLDEDKKTFHIYAEPIVAYDHLERFLKKKALEVCKEKCRVHAKALGVSFRKIQIKEYKARWGSCAHSSGEISLSWRLIMAPPSILDYVCAHEVAHLIHPNHSVLFWETVARICPHYKRSKTWLKKNAMLLFQNF